MLALELEEMIVLAHTANIYATQSLQLTARQTDGLLPLKSIYCSNQANDVHNGSSANCWDHF
jgi:hypothetical protein